MMVSTYANTFLSHRSIRTQLPAAAHTPGDASMIFVTHPLSLLCPRSCVHSARVRSCGRVYTGCSSFHTRVCPRDMSVTFLLLFTKRTECICSYLLLCRHLWLAYMCNGLHGCPRMLCCWSMARSCAGVYATACRQLPCLSGLCFCRDCGMYQVMHLACVLTRCSPQGYRW